MHVQISVSFFQLKNLDGIKNFYTDVVKYINVNYKSFELMKFVLNEEGIISHEILNNMAGSSFSDVDLFNLALDISSDGSYVLVRGKKYININAQWKI